MIISIPYLASTHLFSKLINFKIDQFIYFLSRRVVELLTHNWSLSPKVRLPAISRLQVSM